MMRRVVKYFFKYQIILASDKTRSNT